MDLVFKAAPPYPAQSRDIVISDPGDMNNKLTRRILRPEIVDNIHDSKASVRATLMHQKRHSSKEPWMDADSFNQVHLKAGEEVRFHLTSGQTRRLYDALTEQYKVPIGDWPGSGAENEFVISVDGEVEVSDRAKAIIKGLLEAEPGEFWDYIEELRPNLALTEALRRQHQTRVNSIEEFEFHYYCEDWSEEDWQKYFDANKWIFGHNLAYQFLSDIESQAHLGGTDLSGSGASRVDMMLNTEGNARFVVLVDIKQPQTPLLAKQEYRNHAYRVGGEVAGGVAQLQSYCETWTIEGSKLERNADKLREKVIGTFQPKALLVVGNLTQLDNRDRRASFELFRRQLWNPEIITYDELLARAKFMLNVDESKPVGTEDDLDDVPC